jgi:RNA polymerase sigma factor (sigma-70 family)
MKQLRSNQQWLNELRGRHGSDAQRQAHLDLASYLYVVASNYLLKRQNEVSGLTDWAPEEVAGLAQDCVQDVLEKIMLDDFVLLSKYEGTGKFTSWIASIIRNHIASLLRRSPFTSTHVDLDSMMTLSTGEHEHSDMIARAQVIKALEECLMRLSPHYQTALIRCIVHDEAAQIVGGTLQRTVGAVHLLVMRAKRQVKKCLSMKGFEDEVLDLF